MLYRCFLFGKHGFRVEGSRLSTLNLTPAVSSSVKCRVLGLVELQGLVLWGLAIAVKCLGFRAEGFPKDLTLNPEPSTPNPLFSLQAQDWARALQP